MSLFFAYWDREQSRWRQRWQGPVVVVVVLKLPFNLGKTKGNRRDIEITFLPIDFISFQHMMPRAVSFVSVVDDFKENGIIYFTFRTIGILL